MFEAAAGDLVADAEIQNQAVNNDEATFRDHVFPERYLKALLSRLDRNSDLIFSYLDSDELQAEVMDIFAVRGAEAGHRRPPADMSHRRLAGPRPGVGVLGVQVHPALGHPPAAQGRRG